MPRIYRCGRCGAWAYDKRAIVAHRASHSTRNPRRRRKLTKRTEAGYLKLLRVGRSERGARRALAKVKRMWGFK